MSSNDRIAQLLVESGGYRDLDQPVIFAGGDLGLYYVNAESLLFDGGEWKDHKGNSVDLMNYALQRMDESEEFAEVVGILATEIDTKFARRKVPLNTRAISGGETRDWIFSGPVAHELGYSHISVYKNGQLYRASLNGGSFSQNGNDISGLHAIHIADLLTVGSSVYDTNQKPPTGWVPYVRSAGGEVSDVYAVVDRVQGGPENLQRAAGVDVACFVPIDAAFLRKHSRNAALGIEYLKDPRKWSENYIREHGTDALMAFFDPNGKIDHGRKFVRRYEKTLRESGRWEQLEAQARGKYGVDINQLHQQGATK